MMMPTRRAKNRAPARHRWSGRTINGEKKVTTTSPRTVAAVCVGVDKPQILPPLKAASKGAREFHEWLLSQRERWGVKVESELMVDADGPVTRRQILDAIQKVVDKRACDVFFLYLAGHGLALSAYDERLLLSDVKNDDSEAIKMRGVIDRAKRCGLPHVVIIYDACRSVANTERLRQIEGGQIFPGVVATKIGQPIDVFYACAPDESAFETGVTPDIQPDAYAAFFTTMLLGALRDPPDTIVRTIDSTSMRVIPSHTLEKLLEEEVPLKAAAWDPPFEQTPDIEVLSDLPAFFAHGPAAKGASKPGKKPIPSSPPGGFRSFDKWIGYGALPKKDRLPSELVPIARRSGFYRVAEKVKKAFGREHFETRTGFTIIGTALSRVDVSNNPKVQPYADVTRSGVTHFHVGIPPDGHVPLWEVSGGTALIQFADGGGAALAILPGYVGTLLVNDGRIDALTYAPVSGSALYPAYNGQKDTIDVRRTVAAAAASIGRLQDLSKSRGKALASYLRVDKGLDPSLGVLAAYAYYLAGDQRQVESVHRWMAQTRVTPYNEREILSPVPFDVALLANKLTMEAANTAPGIAPCCPWLALGWSMLDLFDIKLHQAIVKAARYRRLGTWTAFDRPGVEVLREAMVAKEIR
jgi:Caspase domain